MWRDGLAKRVECEHPIGQMRTSDTRTTRTACIGANQINLRDSRWHCMCLWSGWVRLFPLWMRAARQPARSTGRSVCRGTKAPPAEHPPPAPSSDRAPQPSAETNKAHRWDLVYRWKLLRKLIYTNKCCKHEDKIWPIS